MTGIHATQLSCQGLVAVHLDADGRPTFYGQPVVGYADEMRRRGEGHVYGCDLIGHGLADMIGDGLTFACSGCGASSDACSWSQTPAAGRGDCCPDCRHLPTGPQTADTHTL